MTRRELFLKILIVPVAGSLAIKLPVKPKVIPVPRPESFEAFAFPMIKRVCPDLIMRDLVTTQPMSGPSGLAFHMNFVTSKPWWHKLWPFKRERRVFRESFNLSCVDQGLEPKMDGGWETPWLEPI